MGIDTDKNMYKLNSWTENKSYATSKIAKKYLSTACGSEITTACGTETTACGSEITTACGSELDN